MKLNLLSARGVSTLADSSAVVQSTAASDPATLPFAGSRDLRQQRCCYTLQAAKIFIFSILLSVGCILSASAQSTGALTGISTAINAPQTVDLSSLGTSDWAHWGLNGVRNQTSGQFDHKIASGTVPVGLISNYAVVGSGKVVSFPHCHVHSTWTDGMPSTSASTTSEVYIANNGNGFSLSVPADTTSRTFTVYVGGYDDYAKLTARLSDGSAADFIDTSYGYNKPGNTNGHNYQAAYTLTYHAASAGQKLTVSWIQTSSAFGYGNVNLQAAALAVNPSVVATPTGLTATPQWATSCPVCGGMAMAHILLAWDAVSGATSYTVYRGGTKVQDGLTSPAWTDMTVVSGTSYTYTVIATGAGGESSLSDSATAIAPSAPAGVSSAALIAPTNLCVQGLLVGGEATDVLSWTPTSGAVSYNIYQYGNLIGSSKTPTYTVPLALYNSSLTYTVTALDSLGMESLPSALAGAQLTFDLSTVPGWVSKVAPPVPANVTATAQWNNGSPRVLVVWTGDGNANTYNVYRDGVPVAHGLWDLYYLDSAVHLGETHTYSVSSVNTCSPGTSESAHTSPVTALALTASPAPLGVKVQITKVVPNDDSAVIFFNEIPGVTEYRVYDVLNPNKVKYAGVRASNIQGLCGPYIPIPLSIEWNGLDPVNGSDLVVEAVDKLGPFQIMDGMAGPGAMQMNGSTRQAINGQGDPSNLPNVLASSDPFHVNPAPTVLSGSQVFFDNFRNEHPLVMLPMPALDTRGQFYGESGSYMEQGNDKWIVKHFGTDLVNTKVFFMGNHLMDTEYDGGGPGSSIPPHNNNASLVFQPKATADISGGKVLHVTFEVDAHFDGRRWCDLFVGPANDTLLQPGKFSQDDGGNNKANVSTQLFRWEIKFGHSVLLFNNGVETDLVQPSDWGDSQSLVRSRWDGGITLNGTTQDLDKRHRFDLYLSQTHYRISETTPDGTFSVFRDKDFPAGSSLPFTNCQVYFIHQVYHTGNDRPECLTYSHYDPYWYNYRPWGDERHWDNMGEEVLSAFPPMP